MPTEDEQTPEAPKGALPTMAEDLIQMAKSIIPEPTEEPTDPNPTKEEHQ